MRLLRLSQLHFRNLRTPRLDLCAGITAVVGRNASGKSNLVDACYLGLSGELPGGTIAESLRIGEDEGFVGVELEHAEGRSRIHVGLAPGRKLLRLDGQAARTLDIARVSAAVRVTPADAGLVHGSPSGRRGYLDTLLAKLSARYALLLREYHRVVEQRNALLKQTGSDASLEVWDERFVELGAGVEDLRRRAVGRIAPIAAEVYAEIAADGKAFGVALQRADGRFELAQALERARAEERARGVTVVGPHREELVLTLDGHAVQAYGSRGEARTAALALRVAEYRLLSERHGEAPVLLLDDFTAELDENRRGYLLELAAATPQTLVTGTEPPPRFDALLRVRAGEITGESPAGEVPGG